MEVANIIRTKDLISNIAVRYLTCYVMPNVREAVKWLTGGQTGLVRS